jgi:hypothetical protein
MSWFSSRKGARGGRHFELPPFRKELPHDEELQREIGFEMLQTAQFFLSAYDSHQLKKITRL